MANVNKLLFDCVAVVDLLPGDPPTPKVVKAFPRTKSVDDPLFQQVSQFCFPDPGEFPKSKMKSETFSFVLTDTSGNRQFGYCRRLLQKGKRWPRAFVILSFHACYSIFHQVLGEVEVRSSYEQFKPVEIFIDAVLDEPFPEPGQSIMVGVCSWSKPGAIDEFVLRRPTGLDSLLDFVDFETLLKLMESRLIVQLFSSLLIERRIVFVASHLADLTAVINAMMALLYPFTWQHIFVPVLPPSLLTFCCAPMPFVVGILRSSLEEVLDLPMESAVFADIDHKKVVRRLNSNAIEEEEMEPENDIVLMDPVQVDVLVKGLDDNRGKRSLTKNEKSSLSNPFLLYIVRLILRYPDFIDGLDFQKLEFLTDVPPADRQMVELLIGSQLFDSFVQKRAEEYSALSSPPTIEEFAKLHTHDPFDQMVLFSLLSANIASGTASHTIDLSTGGAPGSRAVVGEIYGDWLTKLGGKISPGKKKNWNRRWFVLRSTCVEYSKSQSQAKPTGIIDLYKVTDVLLAAPQTVSQLLSLPTSVIVLELVTAFRTYYIFSDDNTVVTKWYNKIHSLMEKMPATSHRLSARPQMYLFPKTPPTQSPATPSLRNMAVPSPSQSPSHVAHSPHATHSPFHKKFPKVSVPSPSAFANSPKHRKDTNEEEKPLFASGGSGTGASMSQISVTPKRIQKKGGSAISTRSQNKSLSQMSPRSGPLVQTNTNELLLSVPGGNGTESPSPPEKIAKPPPPFQKKPLPQPQGSPYQQSPPTPPQKQQQRPLPPLTSTKPHPHPSHPQVPRKELPPVPRKELPPVPRPQPSSSPRGYQPSSLSSSSSPRSPSPRFIQSTLSTSPRYISPTLQRSPSPEEDPKTPQSRAARRKMAVDPRRGRHGEGMMMTSQELQQMLAQRPQSSMVGIDGGRGGEMGESFRNVNLQAQGRRRGLKSGSAGAFDSSVKK